MSNIVTITAAFGSSGQGDYLFAASGTLMTSSDVAIVTPVVNGVLDSSGNLSAALLASDNFGAGELNWNCFVRVQGLPIIHVVGFPVNYDDGASQNLFTVLAAAGWAPEATS
jgi:hypothetical protein